MPAYPEQLPVQDVEDDMLDADDAGEEIDEDSDAPMSDDDGDNEQQPDEEEQEEIPLQNDSIAHFDAHKDSIFTIAQHPVHPAIVATGAADDLVYTFDYTSAGVAPHNPADTGTERPGIQPLQKFQGHTDSPNAILFTQPAGEYLVSAGLDGQLRAYHDVSPDHSGRAYELLATAKEVEEINFLVATPHPNYPNTFALGASDGSVWIYTVDAAAGAGAELSIVQAFYLHTAPATAGAWSPDGKLLCTVSEDGSFYAWDVFGEAAAAGVAAANGQAVVGLTQEDERFRVEGGLFAVGVAPNGAFAAVGGAEGHIRVVGLPRLSTDDAGGSRAGAGAKAKAGGGKQAGAKADAAGSGQAGQILASLQAQQDSVESIAFAPAPLTLMASAAVDGSIALFDTARRFATRRHIRDAHEGEAVIKVEFAKATGAQGEGGWIMTTCGNDGVVRRWDARGANVGAAGAAQQSLGQAATAQGMLGEWRGHRGGGEGGGVLGFVQNGGRYVVTAGDDGVALVFDTQP